MRRFSILSALTLVIALTAPAFAEQKIAVFRLGEITAQCDKSLAERDKIEKTFGNERASLQQLEDTIRKKSDELRVQASALSRDAQEDRQAEIIRLQRDYEDAARILGRKLEVESNRIQEEIIMLVAEATKNYAEKNKIDVVLETTMVVMYSSPEFDITEPLLLEVNALWKAQGSK